MAPHRDSLVTDSARMLAPSARGEKRASTVQGYEPNHPTSGQWLNQTRQLSPEQKHLQRMIIVRTSDQLKPTCTLWASQTVMKSFKQEAGPTMLAHGVEGYMKRGGFTPSGEHVSSALGWSVTSSNSMSVIQKSKPWSRRQRPTGVMKPVKVQCQTDFSQHDLDRPRARYVFAGDESKCFSCQPIPSRTLHRQAPQLLPQGQCTQRQTHTVQNTTLKKKFLPYENIVETQPVLASRSSMNPLYGSCVADN